MGKESILNVAVHQWRQVQAVPATLFYRGTVVYTVRVFHTVRLGYCIRVYASGA